MTKEEDKCLPEFKKEYEKLAKKHNLPSFAEMNKDFHIEKLAEVETDYLIREIRRFASEKFFNYFRFIESLLNPSNASMFTFSIVKTLGTKEKDKLSELYKKFAELELEFILIDVEYSEEKEAKFLKSFCKEWQEIKKEMSDILEFIKKNWKNKSKVLDKNYFG